MRALVVIPARGGSKGIPRKNMRLLHGKPLISYAIQNAVQAEQVADVVVTSDCDEILTFAENQGVRALRRSGELAEDSVPLDPVIYDAYKRMTSEGRSYDAVVTLQPTSPLLSASTLNAALSAFEGAECDTMISVVNRPHLAWTIEGDRYVPAYVARLNRQDLPSHFLETGAFLICRSEVLESQSRVGERVDVFQVPDDEAVDIDSVFDWICCEAKLAEQHVVFRADGHKTLGMGHIHRVLGLAYAMVEHRVTFVCDGRFPEGPRRLRAANMNVVEVESDDEFLHWLDSAAADVVVVDCLDTETTLINGIRQRARRVVTLEDLGPGAYEADAVINDLYEGGEYPSSFYVGKDYVCLRDEFIIASPKDFSPVVRNVFVMFGGADPLNLTERVYTMALGMRDAHPDIEYVFMLGPAYGDSSVVIDRPDQSIRVMRGSNCVSHHMRQADLAFTSQGRGTFELASLGVPSIVIAQNEREQTHVYAQMNNGFVNLGLGSHVSDEDIASTFEWLLKSTTIRREMRDLMLKDDLRTGARKVKRIILGDVR